MNPLTELSHRSHDVMAAIAEDVARVEQALREAVRSDVALVEDVGRHTLDAGGKRLRPAFVALSARAVGNPYDPERAVKLGACLEMVHMATLIHDDVIDHSDTRRGRPTAAALFGNTGSILSGDALLAKAMVILADDGDLAIIRAVSRAVVEMAEGEALELATRGNFELSEDEHRRILRMKTASFVECCCHSGARIAGAGDDVREGLTRYGHHLGMAFQIVDDLLDYRGDQEATGKPIATDFREGCVTLPLIALRDRLRDEELAVVRRKFGNGVADDELRMIGEWMEVRGAFAAAEEAAQAHVRDALTALEPVPESDAKALLEELAAFVLRRDA